MMVGIGYNDEKDSELAARHAAKQAIDESDEPSITFLFTTDNYNQEKVLSTVKEVIGESKLIGACTPGIITSKGILRRGIGVCTISGKIKVETHLEKNSNSWRNGEKAGKILKNSGINSGTVFVFPDGFADNISDILRGLYNSLGPNYTYIGGCSGDNLRFSKTYQFTEKGVHSRSLAVAIVKGIEFSSGVGHGLRHTGYPMIVTKAAGKRVYEIDGRPAFDVYSECLGGISREDFPTFGMKYPLGLPYANKTFLIRDPIDVKEDGSIEFVTEVPQNSIVTLMKCDVNELIVTAEKVAQTAIEGVKSPKIALIFDCISRYMLMGRKFEEEFNVVKKTIGDLPILGMLTFGEVYGSFNVPVLHNKTIVVAVGGKRYGYK